MEIDQHESDRLWNHYQNQARESFDSSYSRLQFLAKRCQRGSNVLNIGVGSGYLEALLIQGGVSVYSLDPSDLTVERLREELGMGSRARQGYSHAIPFPDDHFDCVIMTEVLEHIPKETIDASLGEVRRVLKEKSGRLVGTVPFREVLRDNEVYCPSCHMQFHRWGHLHSFDVSTLGGLLRKGGFTVDKLYPRTFPDFSRPGVRLFLRAAFRYLLGRIGEPLVAPNLYFSARPRER